MLWTLLIILCIALFILSLIYLSNRITKLGIKNKYNSYLILLSFIIILSMILNYTTTIIIIIHYAIISIFIDIIFLIIKLIRKKDFKYYYGGIITLVFTTIYVCIGIYNVYNVKMTTYNFKTNKTNNSYKIGLISDTHIGTTFNANKFNNKLKDIESNNIDLLLIAGDFIDDSTTYNDMIKSCEYLGKTKTKYGIYFIEGNHDKGYYGNKRGYSYNDLLDELSKNNIKVLKDENILINNDIYIIGRNDKENINRKSIKELIKDIDTNKYIIDVNHEPTDYDNESDNNIDLVLSGHTHGGQLIPLNLLSTYVSDNDNVYGLKKIKNTNFIITSGLSDWELKIKTGCFSEYVIININ